MTTLLTLVAWAPALLQDPGPAGTDRVALSNGAGLVGRIVRITPTEVRIRVGAAEIGLSLSQVAHIEWSSAPDWDPMEDLRRTREAEPPPAAEAPKAPEPKGAKPGTPTAPTVDSNLKQEIDGLVQQLNLVDPSRWDPIQRKLANCGGKGQMYLAELIPSNQKYADPLLTAILLNPATDGLAVLTGQLDKVSDEIKSRIMIALGSRAYEDAADAVARQTESKNVEVQITAANALAQIGRPAHVENMLNLLDSAEPSTAERIVAAVLKLEERYGETVRAHVTARALVLCRSSEARSRANGALVGGRMNLPDLRPPLLLMIQDESPEPRAAAIMALSEMNANEAIGPLSDRAMVENDQWTVIQIVQAVAKICQGTKDYRPLPGLIRFLKNDNFQVRERASVALQKITGENLGADAEAWGRWYGERVEGR